MVTQEQAERYDVYSINAEERTAVSQGGDVGSIVGFFDNSGNPCSWNAAVTAIVEWPEAELWSSVDLRGYEPQTLH